MGGTRKGRRGGRSGAFPRSGVRAPARRELLRNARERTQGSDLDEERVPRREGERGPAPVRAPGRLEFPGDRRSCRSHKTPEIDLPWKFRMLRRGGGRIPASGALPLPCRAKPQRAHGAGGAPYADGGPEGYHPWPPTGRQRCASTVPVQCQYSTRTVQVQYHYTTRTGPAQQQYSPDTMPVQYPPSTCPVPVQNQYPHKTCTVPVQNQHTARTIPVRYQ